MVSVSWKLVFKVRFYAVRVAWTKPYKDVIQVVSSMHDLCNLRMMLEGTHVHSARSMIFVSGIVRSGTHSNSY